MLSAVGIHLADLVQEAQEPAAAELTPATQPQLAARLEVLEGAAVQKLLDQGFIQDQVQVERFLNLR